MNRWLRYAKLAALTFVVSAAASLLNAPGAAASSYADAHLIFQYASGRNINVGSFVVTGRGTGSIVSLKTSNPGWGWPTSAASFHKSMSFNGSSGDVTISRNGGTGLDCQQTYGSGYYDSQIGGWVIRNTGSSEHFTISGLSNPSGPGSWSSNVFTVVNGSSTKFVMTWKPSAPVNGTVQGYKVDASWASLGAAFAANVNLSGVGGHTTNPFYFSGNVPAGTHTLTAYNYGGKTAYWIKTSTNGAGWVDHAGSSATFNVPSGKVVNVRIFYKPIALGYAGSLDGASCTAINGWAENLDLPAGTISVTLKSGATTLATIPAGTYRADVGNHSFSFTPPPSLFDGATHVISAVLIKTAGGTQVLSNSPRTLGPCFPQILHKIFNINIVNIIATAVRDNETFPFNLLSYMFPDTGSKGGAFHLWLSGIYDNNSGVVNSDSSNNASLDAITTINNLAENMCVVGYSATCKNRLPLAYVPQDDGSGKAGSTTPNGNIWMSLRQTNVAGADAQRGGIASNDKSNIGGFSGVHLNRDEISKVRVSVSGIQTDANNPGATYGQPVQGLLSPSTQLQADARSLNLPTGSQGPSGSGIWDNVRNPTKANSNYTATMTAGSLDFTSPSSGIFSSPGAAAVSLAVGQQYLTGTATSLLQDGQGNGYHYSNEPLSLTAGVTAVSDVKLKWDEYVDWSQVDDKGHYYPTSSGVSTGFELGAYTPAHYQTLSYLSGGSVGSPVYQYTTYYYSCYNATTKVTTYGNNRTGSVGAGCSVYYSAATYNYSTACQSTGPTYAYNTYGSASWRTPNNESRFGWYNSTTKNIGSTPTGGNGGSAASAFGPNFNTNPAWSQTGNTAYWQDPNVTAMNTSGATTPPSQSPQWIYNASDPLYSNRMIFDGSNSTSYANGYTVGGSDSSCYYNAPGSGGSPATTVSYSQYIDGYYASPRYLYENSSAPTTTYYGLYGAGATFDGRTDGSVMTGWAWVSNKQRVRYENTWSGRSRDLGPRTITGSDATDDLLYGPDFNGSASQPARDSTMIYNPTISGASGDIFSGGSISGYFSGNQLAGAYLFANGNISNFSGTGSYVNYFNNPSTRSGTTYGPGAPDALHQIFPNFSSTIGAATATLPATGGTILLNKTIFKKTGDLTLSAATFCSGAGTIYVTGNLIITGDLSYCNGTSKADVPSVGFVVGGNITVAPNVRSIVGTFVANGGFTTQSNLTAANRSATTGDVPFLITGSMIASSYDLQRQLSGISLAAGLKTETFNYDGRVVVSPPPGFNSLSGSIQAVLNEAVPSN